MRRAGALLLLCAGLAAASLWLATATAEYNTRLEREKSPTVFDFFSYYRPNAEYAFERMRRGDLPLWNPHNGIGAPLLATLQTGILYPPNVLHLLLPVQGAYVVLASLHVLLAAVFAGALARRCGAGALGSITAGVLYALSFQLRSSAWTPPTLYAAAWMPAVLATVLGAVDEPGPRRAAALAGALAMQILAGWPYTVVMTALCAVVLGGTALLQSARERRRLPLAALATLALGAAGGAALAAPQLLPAVELMERSTRAPGALDERMGHSRGDMHDPAIYVRGMVHEAGGGAVPGLASPLLAALAVVLAGARRGRALALLAAGLAALAISFPHSTPLYDWIRRLPLLGDFRFPFRYRLVTTLALAVGAGIGVSRLEQRGTRRTTALAAVAAAITVATLVIPVSRLFSRDAAFPRKRAQTNTALLAGYTGDTSTEAQRALMRAPENAGWRSWWRGMGGFEKLGVREGILTLQDLEPLSLATLGRIMEFLSAEDTESGHEGGAVGPAYSGSAKLPSDASRTALLDLLSVRFVVVNEPPAWLASRWRRVESISGPPEVFRNDGAVPRAWRASRAELEPPDPTQALTRLVDPGFDFRRTVLLDSLPPALESSDIDAESRTRIEVDEAEHVVIRTAGNAPAVLVLNDAWYPGWRATLDGAPAPILRANTAFRAVAVPAGDHAVEMRYEPRSFRLGVGAAVVAGALLLAAQLGIPKQRGVLQRG